MIEATQERGISYNEYLQQREQRLLELGRTAQWKPHQPRIVCVEDNVVYETAREAGIAVGVEAKRILRAIQIGAMCRNKHWHFEGKKFTPLVRRAKNGIRVRVREMPEMEFATMKSAAKWAGVTLQTLSQAVCRGWVIKGKWHFDRASAPPPKPSDNSRKTVALRIRMDMQWEMDSWRHELRRKDAHKELGSIIAWIEGKAMEWKRRLAFIQPKKESAA